MAVPIFAPRADDVSLILDALKKSENARQQKSGPALAAAPGSSASRRSSPWPWILGAVLLANAVLLGILLTRGNGEPAQVADRPDGPEQIASPVPASAPATEPASAAAGPPQRGEAAAPGPGKAPEAANPAPRPAEPPVMLSRERRIQSLDTMVGRRIAPPRAAAQTAAGAAPAPEPRGGTVVYEGEPQPGDRPAPEPGTVVYEGAATPDAEPRPSEAPGRSEAPAPDAGRSLPTYQDLQLRGELSLAPMHIDIHVYSDNEAERFVFINMRKYIQGDKTTEGPIVESINADGVTLSHQGRRFSLPRD